MSDQFTQADAEALGWRFVHEQPAYDEALGDGITRSYPASYVAEKNIDGGLITEQAEEKDLLVERIRLYETRLQSADDELPAVPQDEEEPSGAEDVTVPAVTPVAPGASGLNDIVYDGEKTIHVIAGEVAEPEQGAWAERDADLGIDREAERIAAEEARAEAQQLAIAASLEEAASAEPDEA